jgi:PD-(D/E)XK endonuclease
MTQSRNPKATSERSEGIVLGELMKLGKVVLFPFGNNQRYDLVIDEGDGRFVRVQVKTAWWENGCVCSSRAM